MPKATASNPYAHMGPRAMHWNTQPTTLMDASRELGGVVYYARTDEGIIKIGYTENLIKRSGKLPGSAHSGILAFHVGTYEDEQAIHTSLVASRHHGHEWYNPTPEVMAVVNAARERCGMPALAA